MEEARALVADRTLWPRVRDFLWDFAPQVHKSWLEGFEADSSLVLGLMSSPRVKRYVLDFLGVDPCFHVFPKEDGSRMLLLDGATLFEICKWLGALACAESLRRVTDGATVRALKTEFKGVYPEVFGFTAYFKGVEFPRGDSESQEGREKINAEMVVGEGASILLGLMSSLPEPLLNRFRLKLPKTLCASASPREAGRGKGSMKAVVAKLLKLKFPEAYSLCC